MTRPVRRWERSLISWALLTWPEHARLEDGHSVLSLFEERRRTSSLRVPGSIDTLLEVVDVAVAGVRIRRAETGGRKQNQFSDGRWMMGGIRSIAFHAVRGLRRSPRWSLLVVGVLSVGIGSAVGIFTVVDGVALRPLPYDDPGALVRIGAVREGRPGLSSLSAPNYRDLAARSATLVSTTASMPSSMGVRIDDQPNEVIRGGWVTGRFFETLGRRAMIGRTLTSTDDAPGAPLVVVISHDLWQSRFSGADVLGRTFVLEDAVGTIVGVMPRDFFPPEGTHMARTALWAPLAHAPLPVEERGLAFLDVVGRVATGTSPQQVNDELASIGRGLEEEYGLSRRAIGVLRSSPLRTETLGDAASTLTLLLGAVGLLLAIACLNVGNLVMLRTLDRRESFIVRLSLGASRVRVVAEVIGETLGLALAGGVLGTAGAYFAVASVSKAAPIDLPRLAEVQLDARVVVVGLAISGLVGLAVGLIPALRLVRTASLGRAQGRRSHTSSRQTTRARDGLVLLQVAMGLSLTIGAGLLIQSLVRLHSVDPGFTTTNLHVATLRLEGIGGADWDPSTLDDLRSNVSRLPGVSAVSFTSGAPYAPGGRIGYIEPEGVTLPHEELARARIEFHRISSGHLELLDLPLLRGRSITEADRSDTEPVVVLSESVANTYWPEGDAHGKRLLLGGDGTFTPRTVVGVVATPRFRGPAKATEQHVWIPLQQMPPAPVDLMVRADPGSDLGRELATLIQVFNGRVEMRSLRSVDDGLASHYVEPTFFTLLLGTFAAIALLLSSVGLYGTLAHSVRTRQREFGVRLALGADGRQLTRDIVTRGGLVTLLGIGFGLSGAWFGTRLLDSVLFGTPATDVVSWTAASITLLTIGLAASWIPARAAGRTAPSICLQMD